MIQHYRRTARKEHERILTRRHIIEYRKEKLEHITVQRVGHGVNGVNGSEVSLLRDCLNKQNSRSSRSCQLPDFRPVVTLVSLSKTLHYNCFCPPRGKWVPARLEMVLAIDLAK